MGRRVVRNSKWRSLVASARKRWTVSISLGVLLLILLIQLLYPSSVTVPFAKIAGKYHGFSSNVEIEKNLQSQFIDTKLGISVKGDLKQYELSKVGAELQLDDMTSQLVNYPLSLRVIPLSIVFYSPEVEELSVQFDRDRLKEFAGEFSEKYNKEPKNASIKLEGDQILAEEASHGYSINPDQLIDRIESQQYEINEKSTFAAPLEFVEPEVTDAEVEQARGQLETALSKQIIVSNDTTGQQFTPEKPVVASWLAVQRVEEDNSVQVTLQPEAISKYIEELNQQVGEAPDPVKVTFRDGREVERVGGSQGVGVDQGKFMADIQSSIFTPTAYAYVSLTLKDLAPAEQINYTYTNTEAGLAAKLDELTSRYNAKISIKQLDGGKWSANSKGAETWPSASTYKLYVAAMLFSKIETGETSWNDQLIDRSVTSCFESMIVVSANECAEEWLRKFGRSTLERYIYERGISDATRFTDSGPARTSANDLVKILEGFHNGSLANGDNTNRLMDAMGRQIWRKGIPAGTAGSVNDKVGFLWDYTHDAGIVRHPRGTYILAVMTKGHNYGTISQITKEIEQVMYP